VIGRFFTAHFGAMWTGQTNVEESSLKVSLKGAESNLYKFEPNQGDVPNTTK